MGNSRVLKQTPNGAVGFQDDKRTNQNPVNTADHRLSKNSGTDYGF